MICNQNTHILNLQHSLLTLQWNWKSLGPYISMALMWNNQLCLLFSLILVTRVPGDNLLCWLHYCSAGELEGIVHALQ